MHVVLNGNSHTNSRIRVGMDFAKQQQTPAACQVVAMPFPGWGNINPMLDLCKSMADRSSDILITFVVTEEWLGLIGSVSEAPNFRFATIPNILPPERFRGDDILKFGRAALTKMEEPFEQLLDQLRLHPSVIIADTFLPWTADVAGRRNIPLASLWTMSASMYTLFYHFDLLVEKGHFPIQLSVNGNAEIDYIPGLSPIRGADLPRVLREQELCLGLMRLFRKGSKAKYIIFTSFYELEAQTFDALIKKNVAGSFYNIGPATSFFKAKHIISHKINDTNYLKWLDLQPPNSVLYVSLGSFLHVSSEQMNEISAGLNKSGVRFLWVVRKETTRFQEICGERGMVVGWCEDQLSVLCHPSVGGFWSHCGWNSTKEAVIAGLPLITFPIVMDQLTNAKIIVEDWKTGWRVKKEFDHVENLARSDEIAEVVQRFMDMESPERKELTRNARNLQKICETEFADGQSFQTNLDEFTKSILQQSPCAL